MPSTLIMVNAEVKEKLQALFISSHGTTQNGSSLFKAEVLAFPASLSNTL